MRVVLANDLGYCSGIRRAIEAAEAALFSEVTVAATDTLLHNVGEMNRLGSMGLRSVELLSDEELSTATVLLPAHGSTSLERHGRIARAGSVRDLTCPIVNKARDAARRFADAGVPVVVVGDKEHRETRYLVEAAGNQLLAVVSSEAGSGCPGYVGSPCGSRLPDDTVSRVQKTCPGVFSRERSRRC